MARKQDEPASRSDGGDAEGEAPSLGRRVWDQVGPIGLAIGIALLIRAMIIESYYVPSGSMFPTMWIGDHVFVSKFTYGSHVPFTGITLPALRDPERGEIVVFGLGRKGGQLCPLDQCPDYASEGFVKRIVGIPGDTIEVREGQLYVNGEAVPAEPTGERFTDDHGMDLAVLDESLPGCRHAILDREGYVGLPGSRKTVPEDRYYMMGDNRDNSKDSRVFGTVHRDDLKGPVLVNYWAWNNHYSWLAMLNPITWLDLLWNEMNWDRFGMTYDCE